MLFLTECDMTFGRVIGADHPGDYKGALKLSLLPGSLLALHVIAEAQKHGGYCAFIDAEHALDKTLADTIGVNTENLREKSALESSSPAFTSVNKPVSNISTTARIPGPSMNGRKQGKAKSSSSSTLDNAKVENGGLTKKVKRKPEHDLGGAHFGPEKKHQLGSLQGEARPKSKSLKQSTSIPTKSKLQPTSILV